MKKLKKIAIIVPSLMGGGQERVAASVADKLKDEYDICFVVFNGENAKYPVSVPIIDLHIPAVPGKLKKLVNVFKRVQALKKLKRAENIDVSISFGTTANLANAFSRFHDKTLLSVRGYASLSTGFFGKLFGRAVYRRGNRILCVSDQLSADLSVLYHVPAQKVSTLYNAYDFNKIATLSAESSPDISFSFPTLITVGRLDKIKGYNHLLRAFSDVVKQVPQAKLLFLGEGNCENSLHTLVKRLGISSNVTFLGFQGNPYRYLRKSDIFVMTSLHEGFPNAMVEAMACGLPVVSTDCKSGPREILSDRDYTAKAVSAEFAEYGILTPTMNGNDSYEETVPDEREHIFADALLTLINNPALCEEYGKKAQLRSAQFGYERFYAKLKSLIEGEKPDDREEV